MPVFNGERHLDAAVQSILAQTFDDFEFIVIDDGSFDRTPEILGSYSDPRLRVVTNETNIGLTGSLNRGLQLARGEMIARQDADDVSAPRRFEKQVGYLARHPEVALLGTQCAVIDADGKRIGELQLPQTWIDLRWTLLFSNPFVHSAVMLRKIDVLDTVGMYDERFVFAQDYEFWCRIASLLPVANLRTSLVQYRVHPRSMSRTYGAAQAEFTSLRMEQVARLMGWDAVDEQTEARRVWMTALVFGWAEDLKNADLERTVDDVLHLQKAFVVRGKFAAAEGDRHRQRLRSQLARNLVSAVAARKEASAPEILTSLRLAAGTRWTALLRPRTLTRCGRLLTRLLISRLAGVPRPPSADRATRVNS